MAIKTFNRARAFGLILLFALPVAAAGIAYWQQFWWSQQITFRSTSDASFKIQITKMGLMNVYTKTTFYDTTGNATSSTDATIKWYDMAQQTANGCDMKCRLMNICGPLQVAATAVGLATWAMWLIMMIFNKLKHGLLATTGIWIMALLQVATIVLWVYGTIDMFSADVTTAMANPAYVITNIYTFYDYSFALACGSIGWCFIIMSSYVSGLRAKAKLHMARNSVGPSAPEMDGKGNVSKTAQWVV